ncbi:uncharacterized protein TM35_000381510 [Trypanosoma theileri]|uniref:Uncharacterized protein n=1 Tax=Trypanosoma theileri TaxID=67003 RepID=A0A1X0NK70_9TRYP|nr:uncharacterized protein TM35_000381510 [Trypanosoma theileri]ORC85076.1 hypothetical protein TM35_000381510 [Trypanosoma theileri]
MKRMYRQAPYTAACILAAMRHPVYRNKNSHSDSDSNSSGNYHHYHRNININNNNNNMKKSQMAVDRKIGIRQGATTTISAMTRITMKMSISHIITVNSTTTTTAAAALCEQRRGFRKELFEGPLDLKPGERNARKGPPVAHSLPVYKTAHKLNNSVRWKNANLIANVAGGKDYRLRETQSEGTFDETGMYRDWLYGDERRYANYIGITLGLLSIGLFFYTMRVMGTETWDIPAPVLASQRKKATAAAENNNNNNNNSEIGGEKKSGETVEQTTDALAMLKRPAIVSKTVA